MATKTLVALIFQAILNFSFAQTNSKFYSYPSPAPVYSPSNTNFYTPLKSFTPLVNSRPANYLPYSSQPSYAPLSNNVPYMAPSTNFNPVPSYGFPQPPLYPPPPQSYASMMYPQTYNNPSYTNSYSSYRNCTDQTCPSNECCEFNGRGYVCVPALATPLDGVDPAAVCVRPKRCYSTSDCPAGHCCVVRLDLLDSTLKNYGNTYNNNNYGSGNRYNFRTERGECIIAVATSATATTNACRRTVDPATISCPCAGGRVCVFDASNPLIGKCSP